jgi:DegV family protein with EDD domain
MDDEQRFERADVIEAIRVGRPVTTSPPDSGAFFWAYQEAAGAGATAIVSMHLSGRMSATVEAARDAARQVPVPVHVLDSGTTGMSLGYAAIAAARAAEAGAPARLVINAAARRFESSIELIYVDTLEYLRRDGRVGAGQALLGAAFSIKPVLTIKNGEVAPMAHVPGTRRALAKIVDLAAEAAMGRAVDIAVTLFGGDEYAPELAGKLRRRIPQAQDSMLVEASAIVGAHAGPGTLGITVSPVS